MFVRLRVYVYVYMHTGKSFVKSILSAINFCFFFLIKIRKKLYVL